MYQKNFNTQVVYVCMYDEIRIDKRARKITNVIILINISSPSLERKKKIFRGEQ